MVAVHDAGTHGAPEHHREIDGVVEQQRDPVLRPQAQCLLKAGNDYQAILAWLKRHGDQSISEIAAGIASPIIPTAEVLKKLAASGLVTIEGGPGIERVHLTRAGVNVSDLA